MEKLCQIHIGIHKTGSTSLQTFFAQHREALRKLGVFIPVSGCPQENILAHHNIAFELNQDSRFNKAYGTLASIEKEVRDAGIPDRVVLSTEEFAFTAARQCRADALTAPFEHMGYRIEWIVYYRWFPEWADSAYSQIVKNLRIGSFFRPWVDSPSGRRMLTLGYHPAEISNRLSERPEWRIIARSFAHAARKGLVPDFLEAIGVVPPPGFPLDSPNANTRISWLQVELFRRGGLLVERHQMQKVAHHLTQHFTRASAAFAKHDKYCGLDNELAAQLDDITRGEYETLLRQAKWEGTFEDFFPRKTFTRKQYTKDTATPELEAQLKKLTRSIITPEVIAKHGRPLPRTAKPGEKAQS